MAMNPVWHPWLGEARLGASRLSGAAILHRLGAPLLLSLAAGTLAAIASYSASPWWLPLCLAALLAGSYAVTRGMLSALCTAWRQGWWGAAPLPPRAVARTAWLLVACGCLAAALLSALPACAVAPFAAWREHAVAAWLASLGALCLGAFLAGVAVLHPRRARRAPPAIRVPLLPLSRLDDARLPHLFDWQRRETLCRWRSGGHFGLIGMALASLPVGTLLRSAVGVMLLAASLAWLTLALRACADVAETAACLLRTTPVDTPRLRWTLWRYPALAVASACVPMLAGDALLGGHAQPACGWLLCAVAVSAPALRRLARATRPSGNAP